MFLRKNATLSMLRPRLAALAALAFLAAGCGGTVTETPRAQPTSAPTQTAAPEPTATLEPSTLAPAGAPRESYLAPYPLAITLDGDPGDWEGVPTVTVPDSELPEGATYITFAAAADADNLYLLGIVTDPSIITGQHGPDYWNEDSIEFYLNGTNDLDRTGYDNGVVQITIPPLNIGAAPGEIALGGVNHADVPVDLVVVETGSGYLVEMAVPLQTDVWSLPLEHGRVIGFQVHLNGASTSNRNLKLIWSAKDVSDASYYNPSVFGELVFFEIGQTSVSRVEPERTPVPTGIPVDPDALYKQADAAIEDRVEDLLARMTLEEKLGQMTLVEKNSIRPDDIQLLGIGGLLSGGGGTPPENTPEGWAEMVDGFQEYAMASRLGIPLIYGVDAVHGHGNLYGATIFPHNIGLGAADNPALMEQIGRITALEMAATGIYWNYAPAVSVPQDIRWGRTYEGYAETPDLVTRLAVAYLQGLQAGDLGLGVRVIGTPKHFAGDGGTAWGSSTTGSYQIDQGVTEVDEAVLRAVHMPPYPAVIDAGARSIMISFSSWGGMRMHAQRYLITDVLKGEFGFSGFIVSDWGGIDQITPNYDLAVAEAINAGIDMNMVPYDYTRFINTLADAVAEGTVPIERIDNAVRQILTVKFEMGLFEAPYSDPALAALVGSEAHRAVARQAVAESLVLLKNNDGLLPLSREMGRLFVGGNAADDIGIQAGGWTIEWQGKVGDITIGTTILEGIQAAVGAGTEVIYDPPGRFADQTPGDEDVCLAVVGETPYAEGIGDSAALTMPVAANRVLREMEEICENLVVVLVTGRPVMVAEFVDRWDALVAAWLPGTEGAGVADVLFGDLPFTGKLSFTWPATVDQVAGGEGEPLFPFGFGLEE